MPEKKSTKKKATVNNRGAKKAPAKATVKKAPAKKAPTKATAKKGSAKKLPAKSTQKATSAKPSSSAKEAQAILAWFRDIQNRILRGDLMLGILSAKEVDQVPEKLTKAAEAGAPEAYALLAKWHTNPPMDRPNLAAAEAAMKKGLAAGHEDLGLELARLHWHEQRDTASAKQKAEAYQLTRDYVAAHPDDDAGLHLLGHLLTAGFGVEADPAAGYRAQQKAAAAYCPAADFELYVHLSTGSGVEKDDARAFEHLKKAADSLHPRALYNMASAYARGDQVAKNSKKAAEYYGQACEYGNGRACATLAAMHVQGDGVKKDLDRAAELFEEAEDYGFDPAAIKKLVGWKKR